MSIICDRPVLEVTPEQAQIVPAPSVKLTLAAAVVTIAAAAYGILWAANRRETVLLVSLLLVGCVAAAWLLTGAWGLLRWRNPRLDFGQRVLTTPAGDAINFGNISHIELAAEPRDFYGVQITFFILGAVATAGQTTFVACGDDPGHLADIASQIAQLTGKPLRERMERDIKL